MRGIIQGLPGAHLDGLAQSLTAHLPREPIALPLEIEQSEEQGEVALSHQEQRLNAGVRIMIDRSPTEDQGQQLRQFPRRVNDLVHQASNKTQELAKRAVKTTQEGLLQAAELTQEAARQSVLRTEGIVRETFHQDRRQKLFESTQRTVESVIQAAETACQSALRAGDFMRQTFNEGRRQQIIQSMQDPAETVKLTVSQSVSETDDDTQSQIGSSLPAELQALSIRPMSSFDPPSPAADG